MIDLRIKNNPWIFTPTYEKIYKKKEIDYTINHNHNHNHKYHFYRTLNEYLKEIKESLIENDFIRDNDNFNNNSIDKFKMFLNENSIPINNYSDENIKEIFINNEKSNYDNNANKQIYSHLTLGTIINLSC